MKYTIEGFSQEVAIQYGLDIKDLIFLRWLVDFHSTGLMEKHQIDGHDYFWVSYQHAIKQIPIMGIKSSDGLGKRIKQLSSILDVRKTNTRTGSKMCLRFKEKEMARLLFHKPPEPKVGWGSDGKSGGGRMESRVQYDSSINDSSIKDIKAQPTAELKAALKEVTKDGLNIYGLIGRFYKDSKLNTKLPESVLIGICESYRRNKKTVISQWPWFLNALKYESSKHFAQININESQKFKTEPAMVLNIIAKLAAEMKMV